MPRYALAIPALLAITGCAAAAGAPLQPQAPPQAAASPDRVAPTEDILGRWDVLSFEGYEPAGRHGAYAYFSQAGVRLRIECNISSVPGMVRDGRFVTQPGPRMTTEMGCEPERHARDERFFEFFHKSPTATRLEGDRLRLDADGQVLILQRPETRRLAFAPSHGKLVGTWLLQGITRHHDGGGESGIGLGDPPMPLIIDGDRVYFEACPKLGLTYEYSADARLVKTGGAMPGRDGTCPALRSERILIDMPTSEHVLPLLHGNPSAELTVSGDLILSAGSHSLLLKRHQASTD